MTPDPAAPVGLDLDTLAELLAKATPRPWRVVNEHPEWEADRIEGPYRFVSGKRKGEIDPKRGTFICEGLEPADEASDAALIVALRNQAEALLDLVSRQQGVIEAVQQLVADSYIDAGIMKWAKNSGDMRRIRQALADLLGPSPALYPENQMSNDVDDVDDLIEFHEEPDGSVTIHPRNHGDVIYPIAHTGPFTDEQIIDHYERQTARLEGEIAQLREGERIASEAASKWFRAERLLKRIRAGHGENGRAGHSLCYDCLEDIDRLLSEAASPALPREPK